MGSVIFYVVYSVYIIIKTIKNLQLFQQNRYNRGNKYLKWVFKNKGKLFLNLELVILVILFYDMRLNLLFVNVLYFILILVTIYERKKEQVKLPLKYTGRIKRLILTILCLYVLPCLFIFSKDYNTIVLVVLGYFNLFIICIANVINIPVEKMINFYFKRKAKKKLKVMNHLKVIGITGSYGKTSTKNILNEVLNVKYNCFPTPMNYNTPTGLMITVNNYLDKFNEYFIAEMGACKSNEIKELCDLVSPTYGILTKIGVAHLETFGSQKNIQKTKFELIESLPSNGVGILNKDDPLQTSYKIKNNCSIIWIGIDNQEADIYATNIKLHNLGTTFDCYFKKSKRKVSFSTTLLGKNNIYNILSAIALGEFLGLSFEELVLGVKKVKPVEHRLELKKYYSMHLIDDAYNANPDGAKMALDVLSNMPGKRIVVSSGIIELGDKSYLLNKELGMYMAHKLDIVILIGKKQTEPIYHGLIEKKFKKENIWIYNDIKDAFAKLREIGDNDTYVLLQSDLPDIYNER